MEKTKRLRFNGMLLLSIRRLPIGADYNIKTKNIMSPTPLFPKRETINNMDQDPLAMIQFYWPGAAEGQFYTEKKQPPPTLLTDAGSDGLVMVMRQADPMVVSELLLFLLSKNWLIPTEAIQRFLAGPNKSLAPDRPAVDAPPPRQISMPRPPSEPALGEFLASTNQIIEAHLGDESFRPACLAKKMFLCEMQLHRKLKKLAGLSPANYIRRYRLHRSLDFLGNQRLSVSDVCFQVGFHSLEYFSRSFKEEFGVCPSSYRKHLQ